MLRKELNDKDRLSQEENNTYYNIMNALENNDLQHCNIVYLIKNTQFLFVRWDYTDASEKTDLNKIENNINIPGYRKVLYNISTKVQQDHKYKKVE